MSNSYPYLYLSRQLGMPYGLVLDQTGKMEQLSSNTLDMIANGISDSTEPHIRLFAETILKERRRREAVLAAEGD